jgi:Holliday junction resolvase RusA-like endonuclease
VRLVIPGRPVPASRPRVTQGHAYYPKRYSEWLDAAAWQVRASGERLEGPVSVTLVFRRGSVEMTVTPGKPRPSGIIADIDNLAKGCLDAAVKGGLLANDSQVTMLLVSFAEEG